jgi:sporulation protein YlmC with PRC-barrel domain
MDLPVNAPVVCTDGPAGRATCVILNPVTRRITHVVVREPGFPHMERLVPIDLLLDATAHEIQLRSSRESLAELDRFIEYEFIQPLVPHKTYDLDGYRLWPYVLPEEESVAVAFERIPPGELAVYRGAHVRARDGHVGRVGEFLVSASDGHISHLVLREGHLWGQKEVTIPVSEIEQIEDDTVTLKLDKESVEGLPSVPVRRWHEGL